MKTSTQRKHTTASFYFTQKQQNFLVCDFDLRKWLFLQSTHPLIFLLKSAAFWGKFIFVYICEKMGTE